MIHEASFIPLTRKMQLIIETEAKSFSKSFDFNPDFCRDKILFRQHCLR